MAAQLGLDSVEELEAAIDSMEGIAEDGGEVENIAREARVRSAYLDWCKEYRKQPDESRFPTFSSNYLEMEVFAAEAGKEMALNEYADCTEEEYAKLTAAATQAEQAVSDRQAQKEAERKAAAEKKAEQERQMAKQRAEEAKAAAERRLKLEAEKVALAAEREKAKEERGTLLSCLHIIINFPLVVETHAVLMDCSQACRNGRIRAKKDRRTGEEGSPSSSR